ncbi:uncharacterized protein LOC125646587 [Ostrea edulis]|uniref:uncharacterized protein LOC125646587 n=1 Tax=Ostrea edulis TaxID=37623 RepID=UPI002095B6AF|nr:uncharacterized protein LOC125646587 [Ostrea edulis]
MVHLRVALFLMLTSYKVGGQEPIRIDSYDSLMAYLINGADVRYFFNTSICGPSTFTSEPETPVFGGEVKMFVAAHNTEEKQGQMTFSQVQYIDENRKDLNEEIHAMWIVKEWALVSWGKPGFFMNNTDDLDVTECNWTKGEGSIWVKPHKEQKRLESFKEIQTLLTSGEEVRWAVNMSGCKCPPDPDDCGDGSLGNTIKDFNIMKDGSISFSSSMIILLPFSWQYERLVAYGQIYQNNTANFMISYLDPTAWNDGENGLTLCPITSDSSNSGGANFYTTGK